MILLFGICVFVFFKGNEHVANSEGSAFVSLLAIRFVFFPPVCCSISLKGCQMDFTDINTDLIGKFQAKILALTNFETL